ncbi:hypothetical protein [Enterovibrio coralii]|uniref:hypothetical protein n=1 Tax=Enterovibrio coralii TaxID=294935 RepID=UPI000AB5A3F3|nr:hypothetical protein [Enterovibrio coralii]
MTLIFTVLIFLGFMLMLAIGIIFSRKSIKSSCCGAADLAKDKASCDKVTKQTE